MCGILGVIGTDPSAAEERGWAGMLAALLPRGPDGQGETRCGLNCRLGHTRLAVVDLSAAGRQPLANEASDVHAVVNGEIYNYRELRGELEARGHRFRSQCDSEVVVHAYEEWGFDAVRRLRGIFAFAVHDGPSDRLWLVRDAAGVKPLYYWRDGDRLWFASELKALRAHPRCPREIAEEAMWAYLAYRYIPHEMTIYSGVAKLPAAHCLAWEAGAVRVWRHWEPRVQAAPAEAVERLAETVSDSVRAQLMSDVPVGVLLSGGIDSSAVAAIAAGHGARPTAFTCGFHEATHDERPFARLAAQAIGLPLDETVMDWARLRSALPEFIEWFDEPFFDYSAVAVHDLCRRARTQGVKVLLAGDGADELFAGYRWYDSFAAHLARGGGDPLTEFLGYNGYFFGEKLRRLAGRDNVSDARWLLRRFDRPDLPAVNRGQWLDFHTFMVDDILTKVDRASMAAGIEVRVPLLDQRLLDEAFLWPQELLYCNGERKHLLKRALARWVPETVLTRRKKGFGFPLENWEREIRALAEPLLRDGRLVERGFACRQGMEWALASQDVHHLWLLFTAELWLRRFAGGEDLWALLQTEVRT